MRTRVFSPTYPTWALVGGTSRPAGETVSRQWTVDIYTAGDLGPAPSAEHVSCVDNVADFSSAFLFSVETQHTIGYGSRQTTEECPEAIILQCIQSVVGVIIQACMAGIVFAKLARPKKRRNTVVFSK